MPDKLEEGWVRMTNPELPGDETADVRVEAYVDVWKDKGWKVVLGQLPKDPAPTPDTSAKAPEARRGGSS